METKTNPETIGTFSGEPQEPVVKVEDKTSSIKNESKNDSNDDLQGLINNRDALIREKRSAQSRATGLETQLTDMGNVNVTLNKQIDDLLVDNLVGDIVRLIQPVKGAEAFVMAEIKKKISLSNDEDQRRALIENDLTNSELADKFKLDNGAIVYGVDSSGAGTTQSHSTGNSGFSSNSTSIKFGLR